MKSKKLSKQKLMPTSSKINVIEAKGLKSTSYTIKNDEIFYFFDLDDSNTSTNVIFNVKTNKSLTIYILSVNNDKQHDWNFKFNQETGSKVQMFAKCFSGNQANIKLDADIIIPKNTKNVVADQEINGFIFSDNASISTTPALIIDTNNVKASHAVNIARIEQNKIFYLETKGFDRAQAINMLIMNEISFLDNLRKQDSQYVNLTNNVYNKIKQML